MRRPFVLAVSVAALAMLASVGIAHADCAADADCPQGLVCQEVGTVGCPPCAAGEPCDPQPCEPETIRECVPGPCATDADCGAGLRCLKLTYEVCPDVAEPTCAPDAECPAPSDADDPPCAETSVNVCAPPYLLPCQADADCGPGFACVAVQTCVCSGGGSSDPNDEPLPTECGCEPTGEQACQPVEIACVDDSACPAGWACELSDADTPCTYDPVTGQTVCEEPVDPGPGQCVPPYWGWSDAEREGGLTAAEHASGDAPDGRGCQAAPGAAGGGLVGLVLLVALRGRRRAR